MRVNPKLINKIVKKMFVIFFLQDPSDKTA